MIDWVKITKDALKVYAQKFTKDQILDICMERIESIEGDKNELLDGIDLLRAENKELKEKLLEAEDNDYILDLEFKVSNLQTKLDESYVRYTKETSRLEQRNGNLEAKLEAIESNKVAEFSGEVIVHQWDEFEYEHIVNSDEYTLVFKKDATDKLGKRYKISISKDKQ